MNKRTSISDIYSSSLVINSKELDRAYKKLDKDQLNYFNSFSNHIITCVNAASGSGKTFVAVLAALQAFNQGEVNKIYYIRIPDDRSLRLGYLPGTSDDKQSIYTTPFYNACTSLGLRDEDIDIARDNNEIVLCTDIVLRGTNICNSFVIIDEAQNGRLSDLKLILTRISDNCKVALIGHSAQYDNFKGINEKAFEKYIDHLTKKSWAIECKLTKNYRGKLSSWADELY